MTIVFGTKKMKIKRYVDKHIVCEKCGRCEQKFSVYQEYFHLFMVPLFPFKNSKTIASVCTHCNDKFNEQKKDYYLSKTKTPWFMYSGWILLAGFILAIICAVKVSSQRDVEYVANPQMGDVYIMQGNNDGISYYFTKIINVETDSIDLLINYFLYNRYTSTMDTADFFINNKTYRLAKSDIQKLLEKGTINSVKRNYDASSQFMVEKEIWD